MDRPENPTDADGYEDPHLRLFTPFRRIRSAPWFRLCGAIGRNDAHLFPLGSNATHPVTATGPLYLFANDAWVMYFNNDGVLDVTVELRTRSTAG